jgi:CRISPR/Cas system endoribonuclease Cas6 (RAMP superfamily)
VYKKLTSYSIILLWLSTICSVFFVFTLMNNEDGGFNFSASKEDITKNGFYDKKQLGRNEKNIKPNVVLEKQVEAQEAIKSSMLRQNVKLQSTTKTEIKTETTKPIIKQKPIAKPNDGFEIKALPKN